MKIIASYILYYSGLLKAMRWFQRVMRKRITIVTFHRVGDPESENGLPTLYVTPDTFGKTIQYLRKHYTVISLTECLEKLENKEALPPNPLIITFDDGYRDCYQNAFPLLNKYRMPFTMFVPVNIFNGGVDFWWDRLYRSLIKITDEHINTAINTFESRYPEQVKLSPIVRKYRNDRREMVIQIINAIGSLPGEIRQEFVDTVSNDNYREVADLSAYRRVINLDEIKEMIANGAEVGSHTKSHCFLDTVPKQVAEKEIVESKKALEALLDTPVQHFAYPAGRWTPEIREIVKKAAYRSACIVEDDINRIQPDLYALKRLSLSEPLITRKNGKFCLPLLEARLVLAGIIAKIHRHWTP